jgi:hypothetical protein
VLRNPPPRKVTPRGNVPRASRKRGQNCRTNFILGNLRCLRLACAKRKQVSAFSQQAKLPNELHFGQSALFTSRERETQTRKCLFPTGKTAERN